MNIWKKIFGRNKFFNIKERNPEQACQLMVEQVSKGLLPSMTVCENVDVKQWLPEMNGVNVTILCDRLIGRFKKESGLFALITDLGCIDCLSVLNIEQQSSGFRIYKQMDYHDKTILFMEVSPDHVKSDLLIPNDYGDGFVWGNKLNGLPIPSHAIPTDQYNNKYILNFSVCGEFCLDICFVPFKAVEPVLVLSKSFSCK